MQDFLGPRCKVLGEEMELSFEFAFSKLIVISSKLECITFSILGSYTGKDLRNAYCYTFVVLPALGVLSHVALVGY